MLYMAVLWFLNLYFAETVRSIKKYADIPNMDVEKPLKNWIDQAAQRQKIKKLKFATK